MADSVAEDETEKPNQGQGLLFLLGILLFITPLVIFYLLFEAWPTGVTTPDDMRAELVTEETTFQSLKTELEEKQLEMESARVAADNNPEDTKLKAQQSKVEAELANAQEALDSKSEKLNSLSNQLANVRANSSYVNTDLLGVVHIEKSILIIVLLSGALGSIVFAARSFAVRLGAKDFSTTWIPWYFIRIPVGMGIALMLYLVLRGGLFAGSFADSSATTSQVNPFGFAALGALAGMFSRQATEKLQEIFENVFRTDKQDEEEQQPTAPEIQEIVPGELKKPSADEASRTITIKGKGFTDKSEVMVADQTIKPQLENATTLKAILDAATVDNAENELGVFVQNPQDQGGKSEKATLKISS